MRSQDVWILTGVVLLIAFGLYAAVVGSDYTTTSTPVDRLIDAISAAGVPDETSAPRPPSTPTAKPDFKVMKPEPPTPAPEPAKPEPAPAPAVKPQPPKPAPPPAKDAGEVF